MPQRTAIETVQALFQAFGQGNLPDLLALLSDDVEWTVSGAPEVPHAGTWKGKSGVEAFFAAFAGATNFETFDLRRFLCDGDTVVVLAHERYRSKPLNTVAEFDLAMVFTVVEGLITSFRSIEDTATVRSAFIVG